MALAKRQKDWKELFMDRELQCCEVGALERAQLSQGLDKHTEAPEDSADIQKQFKPENINLHFWREGGGVQGRISF